MRQLSRNVQPDGSPADTLGKNREKTSLRRFIERFSKQRGAVVALIGLILLGLIALIGPSMYSVDPTAQSLLERNTPPSVAHPFGTDDLGRDIFSRMISGSFITLSAPFVAVTLGMLIGVPTALIAGYFEGWVDWFATRFADALFAIPSIMLAMAIVAVIGPSTFVVMIGVGVLMAPRIFRVARAEVLYLKRASFVDASRTIGSGPFRILFSSILPNIMPTLIVQGTVLLGLGVLVEAALSFFGLGVQPPDASWGVLLRRSFDNLNVALFQSIPPGVAITLLVLAFQTIGDGLRSSIGRESREG